jgi:hypothetical protein
MKIRHDHEARASSPRHDSTQHVDLRAIAHRLTHDIDAVHVPDVRARNALRPLVQIDAARDGERVALDPRRRDKAPKRDGSHERDASRSADPARDASASCDREELRARALRKMQELEEESEGAMPERVVRFDAWPSIKLRHIAGLLVVAAGLVLLYFGVYSLDWVSESVKEVVTGMYTGTRTVCLMGGAAAAIVGVVIFDTRTRAV